MKSKLLVIYIFTLLCGIVSCESNDNNSDSVYDFESSNMISSYDSLSIVSSIESSNIENEYISSETLHDSYKVNEETWNKLFLNDYFSNVSIFIEKKILMKDNSYMCEGIKIIETYNFDDTLCNFTNCQFDYLEYNRELFKDDYFSKYGVLEEEFTSIFDNTLKNHFDNGFDISNDENANYYLQKKTIDTNQYKEKRDELCDIYRLEGDSYYLSTLFDKYYFDLNFYFMNKAREIFKNLNYIDSYYILNASGDLFGFDSDYGIEIKMKFYNNYLTEYSFIMSNDEYINELSILFSDYGFTNVELPNDYIECNHDTYSKLSGFNDLYHYQYCSMCNSVISYDKHLIVDNHCESCDYTIS